jgi:hypothetical protein
MELRKGRIDMSSLRPPIDYLPPEIGYVGMHGSRQFEPGYWSMPGHNASRVQLLELVQNVHPIGRVNIDVFGRKLWKDRENAFFQTCPCTRKPSSTRLWDLQLQLNDLMLVLHRPFEPAM